MNSNVDVGKLIDYLHKLKKEKEIEEKKEKYSKTVSSYMKEAKDLKKVSNKLKKEQLTIVQKFKAFGCIWRRIVCVI